MEGEVISMTMSGLSSAFTNITTLVTNVLGVIAGNEVLMICFGAGLVGTAIGIVSRLKHA